MYYILMLIYFLFNSCGLILMKLGGNKLNLNINKSVLDLSVSWQYLLGFLCYVCSFLLFSFLLTKSKLTYIYPISAAVCYVLVVILSYVFLKEQITFIQFLGMLLILGGIVLINIAK